MTYERFTYIIDKSSLARFFNGIMNQLQGVRMLCAPTSFKRDKDIADFQDEKFCDFCRYEKWMHSVVERLHEWENVIDEYFTEFNGSWEYYAESKHLAYVHEYGEDEDDEYGRGVLQAFSVLSDLYEEDFKDIVQDTVLPHLNGLCADMMANAQVDLLDGLKKHFGAENVVACRRSEDGRMVPMSREDYELSRISHQVGTDDDVKTLRAVFGGVSSVVQMIQSLSYDSDNKEELQIIRNAAEALLLMDFDAYDDAVMKFVKNENKKE